ncbi:MAG: ATP-dependent DNA helicase RecG [Clostridiales bacterium]|nr:ATP-dependent DNA helicase RecG [Clostridiales bacterium]
MEDIRGLGKARIQKLYEAGITRPIDLLLLFPYKYVDFSAPFDPRTCKDGDDITVIGTVDNEPKVQFIRKGLSLVRVVLATPYGKIDVSWFNQRFIARALPHGKQVCITGKVKKFKQKISIAAPVLLPKIADNILPLYRPVAGVPSTVLREAINLLLDRTDVHGYLPDSVRAQFSLPDLGQAFRAMHCPQSMEQVWLAARALALEKLGYSLGVFTLVKRRSEEGQKHKYDNGDAQMRAAIENLPFILTDGQRTALSEILASLRGGKVVNRLVQGDVGCGKTIVALLSMYFAYLNGHQSVLMAPTEILAMQHYRSAIRFLEPLGVKTVFLSGALSKSARDSALFNIRTHAADVVIGTHALLSDDVVFHDLSLIVTDEQQRFGVNQRGALENKATAPDCLVMTATPIPRTLALCMYGELEQSFIRTLPTGRPEIVTKIVPEQKEKSMFDYITDRANEEQSYVVCPRIDEGEEDGLFSAVALFERLCAEYPNVRFGLLHGRLKDKEKAQIMDDFARGDIRVLVCTTVVEVGIDVPNAVNIVLFNAERYGLSQLHQLRGRVGRGTKKSFCFLPQYDTPPERLTFFCGCTDGFVLAEYDFDKRGAGDFIGTRQHGEGDDLPVKVDADLIREAKAISEVALKDEETRRKMLESCTGGTAAYIRSITMN